MSLRYVALRAPAVGMSEHSEALTQRSNETRAPAPSSAPPGTSQSFPTQKPSTTSDPRVIARDSAASRSNRSVRGELCVGFPAESRLTNWGQNFSILWNGSKTHERTFLYGDSDKYSPTTTQTP
jgi:hypothetical protein